MAIPNSQLARALTTDEPNYAGLRRLGAGIMPQLQQLVGHADANLAANATSLAGMIGGPAALQLLAKAAKSRRPEVRTAAAGALRHIRSPTASGAVAALLADSDKAVRKFAVKAAAAPPHRALMSKVAQISRADPDPAVRTIAARAIARTRVA